MRKVLKNTPKTKAYLDSLPKIYIVGCWAKYGVRVYPFSGKYTETYGYSVPMVYDYDDCNGTCDNYCLRSIYHTTTGQVIMWTYSKSVANKVAELFNKELEE